MKFVHAGMYYPVTDAAMDTESYDTFADGPYLTRKAMEWFWDAYIPDPAPRMEITASLNQATVEQLRGLPPTLLLVDEADPLRDEGEAYAAKLRLADVPVTTVRYDGTLHDFMLLNSLSETRATRAAIAQAIRSLREAFDTASSKENSDGNRDRRSREFEPHRSVLRGPRHRSGRGASERLAV